MDVGIGGKSSTRNECKRKIRCQSNRTQGATSILATDRVGYDDKSNFTGLADKEETQRLSLYGGCCELYGVVGILGIAALPRRSSGTHEDSIFADRNSLHRGYCFIVADGHRLLLEERSFGSAFHEYVNLNKHCVIWPASRRNRLNRNRPSWGNQLLYAEDVGIH